MRFEKDDLPLLHEALLQNYIHSSDDYYTVNDRIIDVLQELSDNSTVQFISGRYKNPGKDKEGVKYSLLELLSKIRTSESYSLLKNLLSEGLPLEGNPDKLGYPLQDSLELTIKLYPEILSLSKDSLFSTVLVDVTRRLMDSNFLSVKDIIPYKQNFLDNGNRVVRLLKDDEEKWWNYVNWIPFIGRFNDTEGNELLKQFLNLKDMDIRYSAVLALAKNNQPLNPHDIEKIAENKSYRKDLYEEFRKHNKQNLFPAKFATQLKIAESEIHVLCSDDDEPQSVTFIGERTEVFMGKKQKFYLFRVSFEGEDYSSSYLGVTGPYSTGKDMITSSEAAGAYWEEEFDRKKIDEHLKKHLSFIEEYLKEKKGPAAAGVK